MTLVRWDPFRDLMNLQRRLTTEDSYGSWAPVVDIFEKGDDLVPQDVGDEERQAGQEYGQDDHLRVEGDHLEAAVGVRGSQRGLFTRKSGAPGFFVNTLGGVLPAAGGARSLAPGLGSSARSRDPATTPPGGPRQRHRTGSKRLEHAFMKGLG